MAGAGAAQLDRRWVLGGVATTLALLVVAMVLLGRGGDGDEVVTRSLDRAPEELPAGLVPARATEVQGQVVSQGGEWLSATVEFVLASGDRDALAATIEQAAEAAGWTFFERVYDATTMVLRWNDADGSALTVTLRSEQSDGGGNADSVVRAGAVAVRASGS